MSRPSGRWGIAGIRWPMDSSTRWVAERSWEIWHPEFAAPTTRTFPERVPDVGVLGDDPERRPSHTM
jgi:hypothetical protein